MERGRMQRSYIVAIQEFYQLPKILFVSPKYIHLSLEAKVMFSFFYSRTLLSEKRDFVDKENNVYFFYKNEDLMTKLGCSKTKVISAKKELIQADLLDEEKTGRASRLYLKHLDLEGVSSNDLEEFDYPVQDETKVSEKELNLRKVNAKKQWNNIKRKRKFVIVNKMHEVQNQTFVHKMFHGKMHEVQNQYLVHSSPLNQHSLKIEKCTKSKIEPSEVHFWYPRYNNIDRLDKNIDYVLDQENDVSHHDKNFKQESNDSKNVEEKQIFDEQYLYDLKAEYPADILEALKFVSRYEDVKEINKLLRNAMRDTLNGEYVVEKALSKHSEKISRYIYTICGYDCIELAYAVKQAIIRAVRFIHKERRHVNNKQGYYYTAIQSAILGFVIENQVHW